MRTRIDRPYLGLEQGAVLLVTESGKQSVSLLYPGIEERLNNGGFELQIGGDNSYCYATVDDPYVQTLIEWQIEKFRDKYFFCVIDQMVEVVEDRNFRYNPLPFSPIWTINNLRSAIEESTWNSRQLMAALDLAGQALGKVELYRFVLPELNRLIGPGYGKRQGHNLVNSSTDRARIVRPDGEEAFVGRLDIAGWEIAAVSETAPTGECSEAAGLFGNYCKQGFSEIGVKSPSSALRIREIDTKAKKSYMWLVSEFFQRFFKAGNLAPKTHETYVKVTWCPPRGSMVFAN
ncbi:MAG: hypothetical protein AAB701_02575 [Patescibacteria group bacterium]